MKTAIFFLAILALSPKAFGAQAPAPIALYDSAGSPILLVGGAVPVTGCGSGTVSSASVVSANGFAGTVANSTTTPAITLSTSITGILKGNGTAMSAAASGTDYSAGTSGLATGILKSTTGTGGLTIASAGDFPTLNQNTTGTASNLTASSNSTLTTLPNLSLPGSQVTGNIAGNAAGLSTTLVSGSGGTGFSTYTKGDTIYSSATNTLSKLAVGTQDQVQAISSAGIPYWRDEQGPSTSSVLFDDFDIVVGRFVWSATNSGTGAGAAAATATDGTNIGILHLTTGSTSTGLVSRYAAIANTGGVLLGLGTYSVETRLTLPTLSTVTEEYKLWTGFHDGPTTGTAVDGVYFLYDRLANGNFWATVTISNSSATTTVLDGGGGRATAAVVGGAWNKLRFEINAAGTQVLFYIGGTLVATHSTNIPTGAGRQTLEAPIIMLRTAYVSTDKPVELDYYWRRFVPTTAR